jgi:hypothetical protein
MSRPFFSSPRKISKQVVELPTPSLSTGKVALLAVQKAIWQSSTSPRTSATGTPFPFLSHTLLLTYPDSFRLVNLSCFTFLNVTLDGHKFTVIEADGVEHQPHEVDSLVIFVGQRYSIIVKADQPITNYCERLFPWKEREYGLLGIASGFRTSPGPTVKGQASSSECTAEIEN